MMESVLLISENEITGVNVYIKRIPNRQNYVMDVYGKRELIHKFIEKLKSLGAIFKSEYDQYLYTYDLETLYSRFINIITELNYKENDTKYETTVDIPTPYTPKSKTATNNISNSIFTMAIIIL